MIRYNLRRTAHAAALAVAVAAITASLSSCSALTLEKLPHPAGVSGATYSIVAEFRDVQNLPIGAAVKTHGAVIGVVQTITTRDYRAFVTMRLEKKFALASTSRFQIRFTTPLGEDYVSVESPPAAGVANLADGAQIPLAQTTEAPGIEDTFAAVSLLLNGGGLDQIQTIARELNKALKGHTSQARDALRQLDAVVAHLDAHRDDIDRALTGLQAMASSLNNGTALIEQALGTFPSVLDELSSQIGPVTALAGKIATLGTAVDDLLTRGQNALLNDLDELRPVLDSVSADAANLIPAMQALTAFGEKLDSAAPGDYLNLNGTIQFLLDNPGEKVPAAPPTGGGR